MKIIRLEKNHHYKTSKDYKHLFTLAHATSIVCMVDYESCRDIAATLFHGKTYQIGARGIGYICAFSEKEFLIQCEEYNVEFIVPENILDKFL